MKNEKTMHVVAASLFSIILLSSAGYYVYAQPLAITELELEFEQEELFGWSSWNPEKPCIARGDWNSLMVGIVSFSNQYNFMDEKTCQSYVNFMVNSLGYKVVIDKHQFTGATCELEETCYQWTLIKEIYYDKYKDKLKAYYIDEDTGKLVAVN